MSTRIFMRAVGSLGHHFPTQRHQKFMLVWSEASHWVREMHSQVLHVLNVRQGVFDALRQVGMHSKMPSTRQYVFTLP